MKKKANKAKIKSKSQNKPLYWTPRILGILFIAFIELFALDVFDASYSLSELVVALFMHSIPALVLIVFLLISLFFAFKV